MNALVGIRANATGLMSPSPAQRRDVAQRLAALAGTARAQAAKTAAPVTASGVPKASEGVARGLDQQLDRDAFLQLLVLQLQNQNPLDPVDNGEMLAQLAQFSALEGINHLNENFEQLSGNVDQLNFISASILVGRNVRGIDVNGLAREGTVESVHLDGSIVFLTVDGGQMSMAGVLGID